MPKKQRQSASRAKKGKVSTVRSRASGKSKAAVSKPAVRLKSIAVRKGVAPKSKPAKSKPVRSKPVRSKPIESKLMESKPAAGKRQAGKASLSRESSVAGRSPGLPAPAPKKDGHAVSTEKILAARRKDKRVILELYERGIKALNERHYQQALVAFEKLLETHSEEVELADRARNFIKICQSQGATKKSHAPRTAEEMFDWGVMEHNHANYQKGIEHFQSAIELNPKGDYIHYALAASYAQAGDLEHAVRSLQRSIQLNPELKFLARNDPDFEPIRSSKEFGVVVEISKPA